MRSALATVLLLAGCASAGTAEDAPEGAGFPGGTAAIAERLREGRRGPPLVVAHRGGATWGNEENSVAAARRCVAEGVPLLETDVRLSRDGEFFLQHDATLRRMAGDPRRVGDLDAAALEEVRLANGEPLPRLRDMYAVTRGKAVLVLDFKEREAIEPAAAWIAREGSFDDFLFLVSRPGEMRVAAALKERHPGLMAMAPAEDRAAVERLREVFGGRLPEVVSIVAPDASLVNLVHAGGACVSSDLLGWELLPVYGSLLTRALVRGGVDMLQTDRPGRLRTWLRGREE